MANVGAGMAGFDGSRARTPDNKPTVRLPPMQARVNLPQMSASWTVPPQNNDYVSPVAPNAVSHDYAFPILGSAQPQVNIPTHPPRRGRVPSDMGQPANNDFENQMRGLSMRDNTQASDQRNSNPRFQAQRPQQHGRFNAGFQDDQSFHWQHPNPATYRQSDMPYDRSTQASSAQHQGHNRSLPLNKQLYNPPPSGPRSQRQNTYQAQNSVSNLPLQIEYLDRMAFSKIPEVEMSRAEYDEKERLRRSLERACQGAVLEHERIKNGLEVQAGDVSLKCFGSMSTTFATKGSDMDLVLVSPLSNPDVSDPESELPRLIEKVLLGLGYGVRLLTKTRVPIIRFCEAPTRELRQSLLAEREKFEKEQEASKSASGKSTQKPKVNAKDEPNPTLPHQRVPQSSRALNDSSLTELGALQKVPIADSAEAEAALQPLPITGTLPNEVSDGREARFPDEIRKEREDPQLVTKSDEERCRLYRLAMQEGWYEAVERKVIITYIQAIGRQNILEEQRMEARVPLEDLPNVIGRYRPPPEAHHLEFPKTGVGIQCDINFSNHLALHNSHLLRCYSICDSRVRPMVLFIKAWTKKRKINTPYHGTLSSYGYVLMVLHYLTNIARPPVLINLQQTPQAFEDELSTKTVELDGHNIQFLRNEAVIEQLLKLKAITSNTETVGSLLRGFFHYFAQQGPRSPAGGFIWTTEVLSLRTVGGLLSKTAKGWTGAKTETVKFTGAGPQQTKEIRQRYLFAIEDPFEIEHNIARTVVHGGIVAIRDEFRRALRLLEYVSGVPGNGQEDLFAETEDKENLQYRAFGPRPRNGPIRGDNGRPSGGYGGVGASGNTGGAKVVSSDEVAAFNGGQGSVAPAAGNKKEAKVDTSDKVAVFQGGYVGLRFG